MATSSPPIRTLSGFKSGVSSPLYLLESLLEPLVMVFVLWGVFINAENRIPMSIFVTSIILFSITFPSGAKIRKGFFKICRDVIVEWLLLASLVLAFAYITRYITLYSEELILIWLIATPVAQIIALQILKLVSPKLIEWQGPPQNTVIIGLNEQALLLAKNLDSDTYQRINILGFFDDRASDRLPVNQEYPLLGTLTQLSDYLKTELVHKMYIALPMSSHPRILKLLDDLKDTTASIYFVPDIFVTDLIQGRVSSVNGIPVVSVCETPFTGTDGFIKRTADLLFSFVILILISPVLLIIAMLVKVTSPGPIIFKQRRYGLDGQEILVYKFRSMTVCEDDGKVTQATKNDMRITPLGAFLRKTSLDELPQFINVLQGRMSVVGPRPHAVAHNEQYRKLIKGYMIRHKVKPGITGWAQVNGFRGETDTLEKMEQRVHYDLEYLRNWSPRLDMLIVAKTIWLTIVGQDSAF
ncbi:undecaprenyl-phosphate glucose phosphotransferase [Methylophilus aquaticus]|uniref:Undecaprenyl-phosphate glucose phosphotransferase n=1 Tax=Methylophilus aquaticus TaxID=1971610 RepID=A0ABT9JT84_9PROT|nr:undecaprenyl-phosphate glucose phosphotransferase [Methylophilus aquaticus]MDP8567772.1 undecaprenyl-phosphate glucose phosphotransferase [Methylophilus aquaticus]